MIKEKHGEILSAYHYDKKGNMQKIKTDTCTMILIRWKGDSDGEYREMGRKI